VDNWWRQYSAGLKAEKKKVLEHKDEDKLERKNMYVIFSSLILPRSSLYQRPS